MSESPGPVAVTSSAHWFSSLKKTSCQGRQERKQRAVSELGAYLQNPKVHWASRLVRTNEKCWTAVTLVGQGNVNCGTERNRSASLSL